MNERWKFQTSYGVVSGICASIVWTLFELTSKTFSEAFHTYNFLFRVLFMVAIGVFILGYLQWRKQPGYKK
jgi:EamA domain-containing membrane protein RarD